MKHRILYAALMLFALASCSKDKEDEAKNGGRGVEKVVFSRESGTYSNIALPYRKAAIAPSQNGKASLVLYLHGGSSKGSDNTTQLGEKGIDSISSYLVSHRINSLFLVPQCPSDKSWGGIMNAVLKSLIDDYVARGDADPKRIYIFGGSMGGSGTWGMVSAYPNLFAAAMSVAGNPSKCDAASVAATPILTVMGTADEIMDIDTVADFCNQLALLGNDIQFEIEDGWTHETTCTESYTTLRLDWIFSHHK
jgi:predicted peptidase